MRLIDKDELINKITDGLWIQYYNSAGDAVGRERLNPEFIHVINNEPIIEAIPLEKWNKLEDIVVKMAKSDEPTTWHKACYYILHCMSEIKREEL